MKNKMIEVWVQGSLDAALSLYFESAWWFLNHFDKSAEEAKPSHVRICREGALYKSHGSGRLLMQSTIVVF
jgi:hypothetical protein